MIKNEQAETLNELRSVIEGQLELLRLSLYILAEGPLDYKWQRQMTCQLDPDQARATAAVAMGAGQSLNTVLKNSAEHGIGVRDLYPIARSVVEGFINGAFFVTQPPAVAQRAMRHIHFASWKHHNRIIGSGDMMLTVGNDPDMRATASKLFPEFTGAGQASWSNLDAASKIQHIGRVERAAGGALLAAYGGIYAVSSEIIHGSVYGMAYFMNSHGSREPTVDTFRTATHEQMIDILCAVSHGASGFLAVFANVHRFGPIVLDEYELFKRLIKAATGEDWVGDDPLPATH
jgi:hypothetical protein